MSFALKDIKDEPTPHLMWFVERGFHQMVDRRNAAKAELEKRGVDTSKLIHQCICNECKKQRDV